MKRLKTIQVITIWFLFSFQILSFAKSEDQSTTVRVTGNFSVEVKDTQTIEIGDFFVSEVLTCRALFTAANGSPIESLRPFCGCVTTKLEEPIASNGFVTREVLFVVKGRSPGQFRSKLEVLKSDGSVSTFLLQGEVKPLFVFQPSMLEISEELESREIELKCLDDRINLKNPWLRLATIDLFLRPK